MFLISKTVSIARAYQSSPQDSQNYCCLQQFISGRLLRKDLSLISAVQKWLFDDNKRLSGFCPVAIAHQHKWCLSFGYYNSLWPLKFVFLILFLMLFITWRKLASYFCFASEKTIFLLPWYLYITASSTTHLPIWGHLHLGEHLDNSLFL